MLILELGTSFDPAFPHGIIPREHGMVCLELDHMFAGLASVSTAAYRSVLAQVLGFAGKHFVGRRSEI
ncbi:hypothetical protein [Rhizobium sp. CF080]|uniref:hypothetical protein n=1 Tax=Rhizobium sp. (strain CF080) TaxID=1144310 RepID=UPI000308CD78|nr:hypothetical protein [Rhizobium sp. CF080]